MKHLTDILLDWYSANKRDLPWRKSADPYSIWLSEIILQQTRVAQGLPYYLGFKEKYPDVNNLAQASEEEVLKLWQGLGYYSRARNLLVCARQVVNEYHGEFPSEKKELMKLKGIGDYTASAIASMAFGQKELVIDGNVYRVLSRLFGIDAPIDVPASRKSFEEIGTKLMGNADPGTFNQALMEFGALQCAPKSPDCAACPLQSGCHAFAKNQVDQLPVKQGKTKVKQLWLRYFIIHDGENLLMRKRPTNGIWGGLYEFYAETSERKPLWDNEKLDHIPELPFQVQSLQFVDTINHVLTHRRIEAHFLEMRVKHLSAEEIDDHSVVQIGDVDDLALPRLIEKFWDKHHHRLSLQ